MTVTSTSFSHPHTHTHTHTHTSVTASSSVSREHGQSGWLHLGGVWEPYRRRPTVEVGREGGRQLSGKSVCSVIFIISLDGSLISDFFLVPFQSHGPVPAPPFQVPPLLGQHPSSSAVHIHQVHQPLPRNQAHHPTGKPCASLVSRPHPLDWERV